MRIVSTGLKALVALAFAGIAVGASAAPVRHDGFHRQQVRHHQVAHYRHHRHHRHHHVMHRNVAFNGR